MCIHLNKYSSLSRCYPFILAIPRWVKATLAVVVVFLSFSLVLAPPTRFASRLSSIFSQIKPLVSKPQNTSLPTATRPVTTAAMASKPYRKPPQAPPTFTATPESLLEDSKKLIERSRSVLDNIVKDIKPDVASFGNVLLPMAYDENIMAKKAHIIGLYQAVSTSQALRDASTEAEKQLEDFSIEASMREDVFHLVDMVLKKGETLEPESRRLLEKEHKSYIRNGLGLPAGPMRDRFKEIKKRLSDISITFQKNLNEEAGGIWFKPEDLDGVPEDVLSSLQKGEGENAGKLRLTFKYPDLFPTLKYAKNPETRKKVFIDNENKSNQNVPLFQEAVILRDEAARLLGYPNHAAFKIEDKMAKTPETVDEFLGDLRSRLTAGGKSEITRLKEVKKEYLNSNGIGGSDDGHYYLWDHRFYDRFMLENEYALDQQKIAEYFPLQTTIRGMLQIFEQLFGLEFVEIPPGKHRDTLSESGNGNEIAWHEDVTIFSVWDDEGEGGEFVGYLYLDLFPREGKYGHAANFNLQPGFIDEKGARHYPATALICNFSKPSPNKPSLLKHDEVVTLFHELGHGIHDLVSRTIYSRFHGTNTVRDFVEAPSQMLENWCWDPSQLKSLSHHYSYLSPEYAESWKANHTEASSAIAGNPPEKMPDALIESVTKTKHVNDALFNLRQLHFGIFDMAVHEPESHSAIESLKISELYNRQRKEITQLDGPEILGQKYDWGNGQATFGHLIGGYDAGYYGYLSSQVYSADMFYSVFKKDPMNPQEGRRYRHTVLERGGSQEELQTLIDFLGRKPSTEAFYKELGISK
ncbi:hypothetical protein FGG08_005980 [Glutinoglossum americanum]|uniref:Peptidase M3A/M3B catalytic domain-containing protein n=1 Tax=Glutinoglossum americanum TaxID=1670608 RepID=A0A9P8I8B4_9PEZI|nr:hypothetical protein FGG08_005980 [Glutinoglossum americanum]